MSDPDCIRERFIFDEIKTIIDTKIYKFLFILMKNIFLKNEYSTTKSMEASENLNIWINEINEKLLKNKNTISNEYTKENLINILKFVKTQNKIFAAEILENILIIIFSYAFQTHKENTFGKYIFNNMQRLKDKKNEDFANWFIPEKFNQDQFDDIKNINSIKQLLENDIYITDDNYLTEFQKRNTLYYFLLELHKEKYSNKKYKTQKKILSYMNGERIDDYVEEINNNENADTKTKLDIEGTKSYYTTIYDNHYFNEELGKDIKFPVSITRAFFISVYIYYQNKHSPLMKYIKKSKDEENNQNDDLAIIPFEYDLTGAIIESQFSGIIMAPTRIEPRISELILVQNILKEKGFLELSKVFLFNKNIKLVDFHQSAIKSNQIESLNNGLGIFDNFTVEELNISYNYIKDDCEEFLSKILSHLKGLKTINLSTNDLKNGIAPFLITLKNLYRKKKIKLENLILNKCLLDDVAFYHLGELLKSKYCKLKNLYLNMNLIPSNIDFLKKLKKNKSLTEIYLNKSNIGNTNIDTTMRIISNTNIEFLYLYKNRFNDFDDCIRMLYRTKLVLAKEEKEKGEKIIRDDSSLYNLDLSNNDYCGKNIEQVKLLERIVEETTLYCIDISHILYGNDPNRILNSAEKTDFQNYVIEFKNNLDSKKKEYIQTVEEIHIHEIDYEKLNEFKKEEFYDKIEKEIADIIKEENSKYPIYLRERARKLLIDKRELFDKDKKLSYREMKEKEQNLAKYMELKRSLNNLIKLKEKKSKKKLILI